MLTFPWSYGVVFTRITRKQFDAAGLANAIEPNRVICADEMLKDVEPEAFQSRLWDMFPQPDRVQLRNGSRAAGLRLGQLP
jgi:hypothetical protein